MTKLWCRVLLLLLIIYGPFLIFQSFVDVWLTEQMHTGTQLIGGITLILWTVRYFIKGPKVVVYGINTFVITWVLLLYVLVGYLVVVALIK